MPSRSDSVKPVKIFLSYSDRDERLKKQLDSHLGPMDRRGDLQIWNEQKILAGENRNKEISKHFEEADIILCLISPNFISSDYCYTIELPRALAKKRSGEARVIPILLRDVDWQKTPFGELGLQILPKDGKPIARAYSRDATLTKVAQEIARVIDIISGKEV